MVKSGYIYGSCRKIKNRVPVFWNTRYIDAFREVTDDDLTEMDGGDGRQDNGDVASSGRRS